MSVRQFGLDMKAWDFPGLERPSRELAFYPTILDDNEQEDAAEELEDSDIEDGETETLWQSTGAERQAIHQAHDNSGHPQLRRFLRMLRQGGVRKEVLQWVSKSFSCEQCLRAGRLAALTPVHIPGTHRFNCVIAADTCDLKNEFHDGTEHWLHILCHGTGYQIVERLKSMEKESPWQNGACERSHQEIRKQLEIMRAEHAPS
eukprot:6422012-Amphidinium_carterae.1